jgi:hypothetical protein
MAKEHASDNLMGNWTYASKYSHQIAAWFLWMLSPISLILLNIGILVIVDLVTGLMCAFKNREKLISSKMRRTFSKMLSYGIGIWVVNQIENQLAPGLGIVKITSAYIGLTEVKSIFENLHILTGADVWSALIDKMKIVMPAGKLGRKKKKRKDR